MAECLQDTTSDNGLSDIRAALRAIEAELDRIEQSGNYVSLDFLTALSGTFGNHRVKLTWSKRKNKKGGMTNERNLRLH